MSCEEDTVHKKPRMEDYKDIAEDVVEPVKIVSGLKLL